MRSESAASAGLWRTLKDQSSAERLWILEVHEPELKVKSRNDRILRATVWLDSSVSPCEGFHLNTGKWALNRNMMWMCSSLTITGSFLPSSLSSHVYKECHTLCHVLTNLGGDSVVIRMSGTLVIIFPACVFLPTYRVSRGIALEKMAYSF